MAVYKRTYHPYRGALTPTWSRFTVITHYALGDLFAARPFAYLFVLCFIPTLIGIGYIYIANNELVQGLLKIGRNQLLVVNATFFKSILLAQCWLALILTAWAGPKLIAGDLTNNALPLFLSRPLSKAEYVLGKFAVLAGLISVVTWVPGFLLFGLQAGLVHNGWIWSNLRIMGAIFAGAWLWIAVLALLSLAISAYVKWRIIATAATFGFFVLPAGFGEAYNASLRVQWGRLLNFTEMLSLAFSRLFDIPYVVHGPWWERKPIPVADAWAVLLAIAVLSLFVLNTRLRAREVVRG